MTAILVPMWTVVCDRCGKDVNEDTDYSCWSEADHSRTIAEDCDWLVTDEGEWCNDCWEWTEDESEQRPKPPLPTPSEAE